MTSPHEESGPAPVWEPDPAESACGPDYAAGAAASRLARLEPHVLVCADGYHFAGREHDRRGEAVRLAGLLPTVTDVLHVPHLGLPAPRYGARVMEWADATAGSASTVEPRPVPFSHPLWVLYSSGTTGIPKGILHGHGGVVLDYHKVAGLAPEHDRRGPGAVDDAGSLEAFVEISEAREPAQ